MWYTVISKFRTLSLIPKLPGTDNWTIHSGSLYFVLSGQLATSQNFIPHTASIIMRGWIMDKPHSRLYFINPTQSNNYFIRERHIFRLVNVNFSGLYLLLLRTGPVTWNYFWRHDFKKPAYSHSFPSYYNDWKYFKRIGWVMKYRLLCSLANITSGLLNDLLNGEK